MLDSGLLVLSVFCLVGACGSLPELPLQLFLQAACLPVHTWAVILPPCRDWVEVLGREMRGHERGYWHRLLLQHHVGHSAYQPPLLNGVILFHADRCSLAWRASET